MLHGREVTPTLLMNHEMNAHTEIVDITMDDYDSYKESIQAEINALQLQQSALDIASGLAYQASQLLDKGEEAFEELGSKINDLQRRLF